MPGTAIHLSKGNWATDLSRRSDPTRSATGTGPSCTICRTGAQRGCTPHPRSSPSKEGAPGTADPRASGEGPERAQRGRPTLT
eukprot:8473924-Pyramimonas_sp.AAC.1